MRKRYVLLLLACIFAVPVFAAQPSQALAANVVISQVQVGSAVSASNEFVELYNNGLTDTEITNWCVYYASASSIQKGNQLKCFEPTSEYVHVFLPSHTSAFLASNQLILATPGLGSDLTFVAGLAATAGHIRLLDAVGGEIDKVGWGIAAVSAEGGSPVSMPSVGKVLQRKSSDVTTLQDTNINSDDFESTLPRARYQFGAITEVVDLCHNLYEIQAVIPDGYTADETGTCSPPPIDICSTITGIQVTLPAGYEFDQLGECQPDICVNLPGFQPNLPDGYRAGVASTCVVSLLPIKITELLPNPAGNDSGNEFIELYNPNNTQVDLELYRLKIGSDNPKIYTFPAGSVIQPNAYAVFFNADIPFTLVNSSDLVAVMSADDAVIDAADLYSNPKDDVAWASIDTIWQNTDQPSPGYVNKASVVETAEDTETIDSVVLCAPNQYRNPETGRCRLLAVASSSVLTPCKDGQYRSEETNRCRTIASDVSSLVPCNENQERNPETGRCRLITSVLGAALAACKAGQERNPETNRCRNVTTAMPAAAYPVEPTAANDRAYWGWLALGGVGVLAVGYGVWEWRSEIVRASSKLRTFFHLKK